MKPKKNNISKKGGNIKCQPDKLFFDTTMISITHNVLNSL